MSDGLVLDGVEAGYGETVVLEGISLDLPAGGSLAVLGRNGVGKTTLLATIMGHCGLRAGEIRFAGQLVSGVPPHRRVSLGIGLVPQEREIFPSLTVEENLLVAARPGEWSAAQVYDLFPSLAARRKNRGNHLSGGEQQMLAIGRALMGNPALLLMDEPLEGLAPVIVDTLLAALTRLKGDGRLSLVLVEQHAHRLGLQDREPASHHVRRRARRGRLPHPSLGALPDARDLRPANRRFGAARRPRV
jgi:branched-chain amino acid transport system ATP-binding protein